jgi:hypothetical protein
MSQLDQMVEESSKYLRAVSVRWAGLRYDKGGLAPLCSLLLPPTQKLPIFLSTSLFLFFHPPPSKQTFHPHLFVPEKNITRETSDTCL